MSNTPENKKQTNSLSIMGLVFGLVGLLFFPIFFGVAGIILSAVGLNKGEPMGKTALIVSVISTIGGFILGALVSGAFSQ